MSLKVDLALKRLTLSDILSNLFANLLNPNADFIPESPTGTTLQSMVSPPKTFI